MRRLSETSCLLAVLLARAPALAQTAAIGAESVATPDAPTATSGPREPVDATSGHVVLVGNVGFASPYGWLEPGSSLRSYTPGGLALGLDADLGVSRTLSVGLWGSAALLSARADCNCTIRSFAAGPLVRYRLVQGVRFDPWVAVGAGGRVTPLEATTNTTYVGIDWLHMGIGGDWYAASGLTIGPIVTADFGTFVSPRTAFNWQLGFGVRIGLDVPGR